MINKITSTIKSHQHKRKKHNIRYSCGFCHTSWDSMVEIPMHIPCLIHNLATPLPPPCTIPTGGPPVGPRTAWTAALRPGRLSAARGAPKTVRGLGPKWHTSCWVNPWVNPLFLCRFQYGKNSGLLHVVTGFQGEMSG